jgi:hypothetical protein
MLSVHKPQNFKESSVTSLSDFRRIALSMPETEELNGMGYLNFRTGRKSFATLEDAIAVIRLTRDQQAIFVATAPEVFAPDSSGWGRVGNTVIRLEVADEATVKVAVATAWRNVAEVGNPSEVVDVVDVEGARDFPNEAEVAEAGCAAEVAEATQPRSAQLPSTPMWPRSPMNSKQPTSLKSVQPRFQMEPKASRTKTHPRHTGGDQWL